MNKLLRKPWVVGALVLGMAALWWVQMRSIFYPGGSTSAEPAPVVASEIRPDSEEASSGDEAASTDSMAIEPVSEHPIQPTQLRWNRTPSRDPFGPARNSTPVAITEPEVEAPLVTESVASAPVLPTLEAVLNTPSAHIAVIDGRIVRVGDKVSGRPVLKIEVSSVALGRGAEPSEPLLLRLPAR